MAWRFCNLQMFFNCKFGQRCVFDLVYFYLQFWLFWIRYIFIVVCLRGDIDNRNEKIAIDELKIGFIYQTNQYYGDKYLKTKSPVTKLYEKLSV